MEGILKISEAANLGIHAMVCLWETDTTTDLQADSISVSDIAELLSVSRDHLGKVMHRLTKMGYVTSRRGPKGGFALTTTATDATLLQILEAIDGPLVPVDCLLSQRICEQQCLLGTLMVSIYQQVRDYLAKTPLSCMAEQSPLPGILKSKRTR
jgi:Rrf2 family protein